MTRWAAILWLRSATVVADRSELAATTPMASARERAWSHAASVGRSWATSCQSAWRRPTSGLVTGRPASSSAQFNAAASDRATRSASSSARPRRSVATSAASSQRRSSPTVNVAVALSAWRRRTRSVHSLRSTTKWAWYMAPRRRGPVTLVRTLRTAGSTFSRRPSLCCRARSTWARVCTRSARVTSSVYSGWRG